MELFYYNMPRGNFGDDLNLWLWDLLLPGWQAMGAPGDTLFGVGTLLNTGNLAKVSRPVVLGSGIGYGTMPDAERLAACDFRAVRGPLTAAACRLPDSIPMLDAAMCCPDLMSFPELPAPDHGTIFVPHHTSAALDLDWQGLCDRVGIEYVSPEGDAHEIIARIARAELVISESMHAAILADACRVPWIPVMLSDSFNHLKWRDWSLGMGMEFDIPDLLRRYRWISSLANRGGRTSSPPVSAAPSADGPGGPHASTKRNGRARLKALLEHLRPLAERQIGQALARARQLRPHLSETRRLETAKNGFRDALDRLRQDHV